MSAADHAQDLPAVAESRVGDTLVQTSDARELHNLLKVVRDFTTWIKGRIAQYGFIEGVDFVTTEYGSPDRGTTRTGGDRRSVTYHLTLGTAKEIAIVENNAEGRRIRRYFIECERRALQAASKPAPDLSDPHALRTLLLLMPSVRSPWRPAPRRPRGRSPSPRRRPQPWTGSPTRPA